MTSDSVYDLYGTNLVLEEDQVLHFGALDHEKDVSLVLVHGIHSSEFLMHLGFHLDLVS